MIKHYELTRDDLVFLTGFVIGTYLRERNLPLDTDGFEAIALEALADGLEKIDKGDTPETFVEDAMEEIKKMVGDE